MKQKKIKKNDRKVKVHDCSDCEISEINGLAFRKRSEVFGLNVRQSNSAVVITATPTDLDCPCEWGDRVNIEFIDIRTGHATQTREQLFINPQLIRVRKSRMSENTDHFTIAGCTLTININTINTALRNGNMSGVPFNLKAVPLRISGRVRCGKRWRKYLIIIND